MDFTSRGEPHGGGPVAARAFVVLGVAAAEDLVLDLCDVAATGVARTGTELSAPDLLDAMGRHDAAARRRRPGRRRAPAGL